MLNFKAMAFGLAFSALVPAAAFAANGYATANVNLRAGPSTQYPAVTVIPVGSGVDIFGCMQSANWCDVGYAGIRGWVSGSYLQALYEQRRVEVGPRYYGELGIPSVTFSVGNYWERHYRQRDFYRDRDRWDHWDRRSPPPRHDAYRPPRGDDHRPSRGDDHRPSRGDDHRPPRGDDHRPPRHDDARPLPPRFDDNQPRHRDDGPRFDNRRDADSQRQQQRDDDRRDRDRAGQHDRNDRHRDAQRNDGRNRDEGRNRDDRKRPSFPPCPKNDDRCRP
ncbi:SH3 domain-containing protein [Rhizobium halophytocola]|uniref:Uncharacterized protein YraI n=1 Tax=Rhizobium halophytocola TaxID=735519 RepID=A0ABS4E2B4_9HYPH|nr:SH3 domain-containing protein [Rhizobium halophytocola]MBP1852058.1 uncharacterized protein YraI [Rhizobium halophytocola]